MATLTIEYHTDNGTQSVTDRFPTLDEAFDAYRDADWAACHKPSDGARVRRITVRQEERLVKTRSYPAN